MGYIRHHAIVVTSHSKKLIDDAHKMAISIFNESVSDILVSEINGYQSFFVGPDGSKEGWNEDELGDKRRDIFIRWIEKQAYEDGSNSIRYAELFYGDDNGESKVERHN